MLLLFLLLIKKDENFAIMLIDFLKLFQKSKNTEKPKKHLIYVHKHLLED